MLKRFDLTEEGFKHKFKSDRAEVGAAPTQFLARLENYVMRWIDLANVEKDCDGLMNLIVTKQYLESCPLSNAVGLIFKIVKTKRFEWVRTFGRAIFECSCKQQEGMAKETDV